MAKRLTIALVAVALFILLAVMPVSAETVNASVINGTTGVPASLYVGESGLDITYTLGGTTQIAWFPSTAQLTSTTPEKVIDVTATMTNFYVNPADFQSRTGNWYQWVPGASLGNSKAAFYVFDPSIDLKVWAPDNPGTGVQDVTGKNVVQGTRLQFRIETNAYQVAVPRMNRPFIRQPRWTNLTASGAGLSGPLDIWDTETLTLNGTYYGYNISGVLVGNRTAEGFVWIKVKTTEGNILTSLYNDSVNAPVSMNIPLGASPNGLFVDSQPWFWGNVTNGWNMAWGTAAKLANGMDAYPPGTYTITAELMLNHIKDNYKNAGADYAGKTISEARTVTLVSDTVKIEANKDTVVRSNPFSVTVTGRPYGFYFLWVKNTANLGDTPLLIDDWVPQIAPNQAGVFMDEVAAIAGPTCGVPQMVGDYVPQNLQRNISSDVARLQRWSHYARIQLNENGVRTIEWTTSNLTKTQTYNIRVENATALVKAATSPVGAVNCPGDSREFRTDEVSVKVEKGAVTITASGDGSYYLGEEVKFSGTNTESRTTYLFIIGPNLNADGSNIANNNPRSGNAGNCAIAGGAGSLACTQRPETFQTATVNADNTWSWKWGTASYSLDAGTYTVYAVAGPNNRAALTNIAYGTVSIIIKKPFVSATVSQSTVAKGDKVYVRGTAEGKPGPGVRMWVLGKNYALVQDTSVESDASFEFDQLNEAATTNLAAGQYFIVIQHPMQNDQFDIRTAACLITPADLCVENLQLQSVVNTPTQLFKLTGAGNLQGSDAAEALVQGINDPNVDDTYTKLQILVEEPVIRIDPIGDRHVGDKFTVTAQTNLAVDDEVLFEIYSSSFKPTQKSQSGEFSGATGTVKVTKGETGMNKLTFDVDASTFKPDEYIVTASAVIQDVTGTALFNVLEGAAPTAVPTAVATTAAPTAAPTAPPTTVATPTKTPTQPGFGALVALIGLGAVAFLVVRRH